MSGEGEPAAPRTGIYIGRITYGALIQMGPQEHRWLTGTGWNYATVPSCVAPSSNHLDVLARHGGIRIGQ